MPVRVLALVLLVVLAHLSAEAPAAPRFESISIRPVSGADDASGVGLQADHAGAQWTMVNGALRTLLEAAYPTNGGEVLNAPGWIDQERYDITARTPAQPSREELQAMLRSLLEEQFAFRGHVEEQERWAPDAHYGSAARVTVQVLVIEHIERPAAN